jgi:hypothetical protein
MSRSTGGRSRWPLTRRRRSVVPRRLVASSSRLIAQGCLIGIERPLELTPLCLRDDLDEQDHDDTGPQCPTERIEKIGDQSKRLPRRRRFEQVSTDVSGQANHEAAHESPVQDPLPGNGLPHLSQVLAHPGE